MNSFSRRLAAWTSAAALFAPAGPTFAAVATTKPAVVQKCGGCFVNILSNGTTSGKKGVKSVVKNGAGRFTIIFARPVAGCAFSATLFNSKPAFPIIRTSSTNPAQIVLTGTDGRGSVREAQYSVVVTC
jgi:hypothetical protein